MIDVAGVGGEGDRDGSELTGNQGNGRGIRGEVGVEVVEPDGCGDAGDARCLAPQLAHLIDRLAAPQRLEGILFARISGQRGGEVMDRGVEPCEIRMARLIARLAQREHLDDRSLTLEFEHLVEDEGFG